MYKDPELHRTLCEVCDKEPAITIQGGEYDERRRMWFCCLGCREIIRDERKKERRNGINH
jgi:hypothetical protein